MSPYANGYISFLMGRGLEQNPYSQLENVNSRAIKQWEIGWNVACAFADNNYPSKQEQIVLN